MPPAKEWTAEDAATKIPATIEEFLACVIAMYESNHDGFQDKFDAAVMGVEPRPDGTPDDVWFNWRGATINTLIDFFQDWYTWSPVVESGLQKIQQFSWLYYQNDAGVDFVRRQGSGRLMTQYFVVVNGMKYDDRSSQSLVREWEKELGDKMNDYIVPPKGFQTFNEFFARELKPNMRPVTAAGDDSVAVSPADAIINMIDDSLSVDRPLNVKTQKITPRNLLHGSPLAEQFNGGTALSCILMPDVYHRFHAPVSGRVVEADEDVAGSYFGIEDFPKLINGGNVGYGYDYSVFEHFRRGYVIIKTEKYGHVAMVPVGLNTIASVIFDERFKKVKPGDKPIPITKGDEIGYFQYGGSLNILLFEKGVFPAVRIPQGEGIGKMNTKPPAGEQMGTTQFGY